MNQCPNCSKNFSTKYTLKRHREVCDLSILSCEYCFKGFDRTFNLNRHLNTCPQKAIAERISGMEKERETFIQKIHLLEVENEALKSENERLEKRLEKVIMKSMSRPTKITNNYVNIEKLEAIVPEKFGELASNLTLDHILKGAVGYAEYFNDYPLKNALICSDFSRLKFVFKDQKGKTITDPELTLLGKKLFGAIDSKNAELSQKYIQELKGKVDQASMTEFESYLRTVVDIQDQHKCVQRIIQGEKPPFFMDTVKEIGKRTVSVEMKDEDEDENETQSVGES